MDLVDEKGEPVRREAAYYAVMNEVRKTFRPEFLNRLDEIVVFDRLGKEQIRRIVQIQLDRFAQRMGKRDLLLQVSDGAKDLLAELGWDPQYGARPLKRAIRKNLEDPLSVKLLAGECPTGTVIEVDRQGSQLVFVPKVQN
jgi:ATP-dependent Clp protease ATP-binding subunit ClpB